SIFLLFSNMRFAVVFAMVFCVVAARTIDNDYDEMLSQRAEDIHTSIRELRREEKKILENLEDTERAVIEELLETDHQIQRRSRVIRRQL
ncbi:hypothetical protein PFISCL1PPCAC_6830, partial [Pristionchus fissidentatus]